MKTIRLLGVLACLFVALGARAQSSFTIPVQTTTGAAVTGASVVLACTDAVGGCHGQGPFTVFSTNGNAFFTAIPAGNYTVTTSGLGVVTLSYALTVPVPPTGVNAPPTLSGNNAWTGNETYSGSETFTGPFSVSSLSSLDNIIYVDGVTYPFSAVGLNSAITASLTSASREVHFCGTLNVNAVINIFHGGTKIVGCGSGKNDQSTSPTAILMWNGGAAAEVVNVCANTACGAPSTTRIDGVQLENMIIDGGGVVNYPLRMEKTDTSVLNNVRVRNGAISSFYAVDSTGILFYDVGCGLSSGYCFVLDWGTGGSAFFGGQAENDMTGTNVPLMLLQGNSNNILISGFQFDDTNSNFGGFYQINGFDTNSSFTGAPAGGAGAPSNVLFLNNSYVTKSTGGQPAQGTNAGADGFVTGTATHNSANIHFIADNYTGFAGTSKFAIETDRTTNVTIYGVTSSNHTVAGASTVNATGNELFTSMEFVTSSDSARITGAAAGVVADIQQAPGGVFQNAVGGLEGNNFLWPETTSSGAAANVDACYGDSTAHAVKCSYNNGSFFNLPLVGTANTWNANQSFNSGTLLPSAAGGTDLGSTSLPFGNLWLGTAATNNFKFAPAATSAQRVVTLNDPGAAVSLPFLSATDTTTTHAAFATATGGVLGTRAIVAGDLPNIPLNQVISPTGAVTTLADGNNPVTVNCAQTTDAQDCWTYGETSAATNGTLTNLLANQAELNVSTASGSTAAPLEVQQGGCTATTCAPLAQFESTWNNASLVGQGIVENVTNTASAASSLLENLRVGNATQWSVDKGGLATGSIVQATTGTQIISGADYTNSTTTPSTVFTWTLPATSAAKTYRYTCDIMWESTAATLTGPVFGVNISAAPTQITANAQVSTAVAGTYTTGYLSNATTGSQTLITSAAAGVTTTNYPAKIWGTIEGAPTAGSTFIINAAALSNTTSTLNIRRGSGCTLN